MARRGDVSSRAGQADRAVRPTGNVFYGTCGWTDRTLMESGGFYPANVRSAEGRLRHYAREFPLVEVDATFYSPPSEENARLWAERAPPDFVLDIKAFGLLTHHAVDVRRLPEAARARLTNATLDKQRLYLRAAPAEIVELVWALHIDALRPLAAAGKLGCVLFQFRHWFAKTRARRVPARDPRPAPLADRRRVPRRVSRTLALLEELGLAYVSVDEPQGFKSSTPPVVACTTPLAVMRLHGHNAESWDKPKSPPPSASVTSIRKTNSAAGSGPFGSWRREPGRCTC